MASPIAENLTQGMELKKFESPWHDIEPCNFAQNCENTVKGVMMMQQGDTTVSKNDPTV
jgi:hypothetical protein